MIEIFDDETTIDNDEFEIKSNVAVTEKSIEKFSNLNLSSEVHKIPKRYDRVLYCDHCGKNYIYKRFLAKHILSLHSSIKRFEKKHFFKFQFKLRIYFFFILKSYLSDIFVVFVIAHTQHKRA